MTHYFLYYQQYSLYYTGSTSSMTRFTDGLLEFTATTAATPYSDPGEKASRVCRNLKCLSNADALVAERYHISRFTTMKRLTGCRRS